MRDATVLFHLPQTVLGVGKSLCPPQVRFGLGIDVGDAVLIAQHLHCRIQFGEFQFALMLGSRSLNQPPVDVDDQPASQENDDEEKGEGQYHGCQVHGVPFIANH